MVGGNGTGEFFFFYPGCCWVFFAYASWTAIEGRPTGKIEKTYQLHATNHTLL